MIYLLCRNVYCIFLTKSRVVSRNVAKLKKNFQKIIIRVLFCSNNFVNKHSITLCLDDKFITRSSQNVFELICVFFQFSWFVIDPHEMARIYILIALLPQLFCTLIRGQESPCPQYFKYMTKSGETIGQIEIQSPPKTGQLHLKIILKLAAKLPTNYIGRLDLARSKEDSARDVLAGRNLLYYYVYFPLRYPIPTLSGIWFNGEKYCSGPEATGRFITTITLAHTLILPNMPSQISVPIRSHQNSHWPTPKRDSTSRQATVTLPRRVGNNIVLNIIPNPELSLQYSNNNNQKQNSNQTGPQYSNNNNNNHTNYNIIPKSTQAPQWPSSTKQPVPQSRLTTQTYIDDNNNNHECGISSRTGNTNLLIANGRKTLPGEWPWLAALFVVKNDGYKFLCGGSILTNKHIITAGHCLKLNSMTNETIHHNVLVVALGRFNLHQFREVGSVNPEVASYTIHPEYAHAITGDSDLAILTLRTPVKYSPFIKPICLWSGPTDLQNVVNKSGYVVGWGQDEVGHPWTEDPRMAVMPIVNTEDCHWSNPTYVSLTSKRTFCAGMRDGTGPCNGDSGSGLVIFDANRYRLRGVVSRSVGGMEPLCDLTKFTVFVDVAKYLPWIRLQISM